MRVKGVGPWGNCKETLYRYSAWGRELSRCQQADKVIYRWGTWRYQEPHAGTQTGVRSLGVSGLDDDSAVQGPRVSGGKDTATQANLMCTKPDAPTCSRPARAMAHAALYRTSHRARHPPSLAGAASAVQRAAAASAAWRAAVSGPAPARRARRHSARCTSPQPTLGTGEGGRRSSGVRRSNGTAMLLPLH